VDKRLGYKLKANCGKYALVMCGDTGEASERRERERGLDTKVLVV